MDHDPLKSAYQAFEPDRDGGFTDAVMARVRAERRRRRLILGSAAVAGAVVSLPAVPSLASELAALLTSGLAQVTPAPSAALVIASIAVGVAWLACSLLETE